MPGAEEARPDSGESPPAWAGAPGYTPQPELPPHAPMPGAPPYPGAPGLVTAPVGAAPARTPFRRVLVAAVGWAVVNVALLALAAGPVSPGRVAIALIITTPLAALIGWLLARRRGWPFWLVLLAVAAPFWILRALVSAIPGLGS